MHQLLSAALLLSLVGCAAPGTSDLPEPAPRWAIAIHGGAGVPDRGMPAERRVALRDGLAAALAEGTAALEAGRPALEVVELVVRRLEDDPGFNAGRGAVLTAAGRHELDASIMDGTTKACGAVTGVTTVRHPITLARHVMTDTRHVLFATEGAEAFADEAGVERVENAWFDTERARESLERVLSERRATASLAPGPVERAAVTGTVGCVVRDVHGHLAAATSTGGMTAKAFGRVGDSPIVGAGTYADDATCAVSCTGTGEEYIRHGVARDVAARMAYLGVSLEEAAAAIIDDVLAPGDGGLIAVSKDGALTAPYNTGGMLRALADSTGRYEVAIWEDPEALP